MYLRSFSLGTEDVTLSEKMQHFWSAFAKQGDPNAHKATDLLATHETWPEL